MPIIILKTHIKAPVKACFDLARSIDLHMESMKHTHEKAIAGVTSGLIGLGQRVSWRAKHFGVYLQLTSEITACDSPFLFEDRMVSGPFHSFRHTHRFSETEVGTLMIDEFEYKSPLGMLGNLADLLFLEKYMKKLLEQRNVALKQTAETAKLNEL
jgi:ligand-binding SRPBCC domain-containing protein